ncbi:DUF2752 domain-containing protein [Paenibacillus ferrarius]|uniref:DUF2752 domain-containing protein n=1 Tax=Paenibacillus ferrarius TaxID=1469647 RepID=UPI0009A528BF|nr:DUF2752 domain-containing protein [Paenibacillus ferrarius]
MLINWYKLSTVRNSKLVWGSFFLVGGLVYLEIGIPVIHIEIPCIFHAVTGLYCPGCGITRVALSLLKWDFYQAFRFNPLVFVLLPLYLTYMMANKRGMSRTSRIIMTVMLIATISFGLLRNIPAFDWLAPTIVDYKSL